MTTVTSKPPTRRAYLTLRGLLCALSLVLTGPLVVLGFVVGLGPEAVVLLVGLDLMIWGPKAPAFLDQIGWSNLVILGSMSRPKMLAAAVLGMFGFFASAVMAAPPLPPAPGALTLTSNTALIGQSVEARTQIGGDVAYAVYRDEACRDKIHDGGRIRFADLPMPPSREIQFNDDGIFYWQATFTTNVAGANVRSGCVPFAVGNGTVVRRPVQASALVLTANDVERGAIGLASANLEKGIVSYELFADKNCADSVRPAGNTAILIGQPLSATRVSIDVAGVYYWRARLIVDGALAATSTCVAMNVPKNQTTLVSTPIEGAVIDVGPLNGTTLNGATSGATGAVFYDLHADAACEKRVDSAGISLVRNGEVQPAYVVKLSDAGSYFVTAKYSGDDNNGSATSNCTPLNIKRAQPTLLVTNDTTVMGRAMTGPRLTRGSANAGGKISYELFGDSACANQIGGNDASVLNGTVEPPSVSRAGIYSLRATYRGDKNNEPASSTCWLAEVRRATPTLTILLPPVASIGSAVRASATLVGAFSATGTTKFTLTGNATCSGLPLADGGTVPVASSPLQSNAVAFNGAGVAYWRAVYSGDVNNEAAASACTAVTVNPSQPAVTTTMPSTVAIGAPVRMTASLSGATTNAGGQFTFKTYDNGSCSAERSEGAGTKAVVSGGAVSSDLSYLGTGTVWWQAAYSGDANNTAAKGPCVALTIPKARPSVGLRLSSSTPTFGELVRVIGTLSGASPGAGGVITYTRHGTSTCATAGATSLGSLAVNNAVAPPSSATTLGFSASTYWQASYSGDANNEPANSGCVTITVRFRL